MVMNWLSKNNGNNKNNIVAFVGSIGCVDSQTQFLTRSGWKNIDEWNNDEIGVYTKDGYLKFEIPENFITGITDKWYNIKTKYGLNQKLSEEHNVYYITSKNNLFHKTIKEIYNKSICSKRGFSGKFITTFKNNSEYELPYSDDLIRLCLAIQADGSYIGNKYKKYNFRFNLKKDRKKERVEQLLKSCNVDYYSYEPKEGKPDYGYKRYYFYLKEGFKIFPKEWWNISQRQMKIICDEISFWDGYYENPKKHITYYSNEKCNADYIQFVLSSCGLRTSIYKDCHRKNINYCLIGSTRNLIGLNGTNGNKNITIEHLDKPEYKYCFTTSTGMWIARRENCIFITGNSGKGFKCDKLKEEGYIKLDFADCLRDMVWRMLNWEPKTPEEYDNFKKGNQYIPMYGYLNGRLILQKIGQSFREIDEDFWVNQWKISIDKLFKMGYHKIMVSDARYDNEINAVKSVNANIKIEFCDYHSDRYDNKNSHESEKMAQKYLKEGYKDGDIIYERR